jgi:hypothetical protein
VEERGGKWEETSRETSGERKQDETATVTIASELRVYWLQQILPVIALGKAGRYEDTGQVVGRDENTGQAAGEGD